MSYYRTCPLCGAHLDPGERCDCAAPPKSQPIGNLEKNRLSGATNTEQLEETQQSN